MEHPTNSFRAWLQTLSVPTVFLAGVLLLAWLSAHYAEASAFEALRARYEQSERAHEARFSANERDTAVNRELLIDVKAIVRRIADKVGVVP